VTAIAAFGIAAGIALAATWPLRALALRLRIMDMPTRRKAHRMPVPLLGGVALLAGTAVGILVWHRELWPVVGLLAFIAALGLVDDLRTASVAAKLICEVSVGAAAIALGFSWQITDSAAINAIVSMVWIVGLTNSFNLLDNMDGLTSVVATATLVGTALIVPATAPIAAALAGAAFGFFLINRPPARMYLGDAGSLTLGFGVALVSITAANSDRGLHSLVLLSFPVALAVFDTTLVITSRVMAARPIQVGGTDHFSHRLRLLGWSPRQILAAALLGTVASCLAGFLATRYPGPVAWLALPIGLAFAAGWLRLLRVDPYQRSVLSAEVRGA
jgi:UDP-N-acetylmuramyl pentapeptide phosphotransferase/UDP-N-acetylglucosamine-1-phosphate transferase